MLYRWALMLLIGGLIGLAVSFLPALALMQLPALGNDSFLAALAFLLSLSLGPLSILTFSAGAFLLLLWLVRRIRR
jgi:hypothetical protein